MNFKPFVISVVLVMAFSGTALADRVLHFSDGAKSTFRDPIEVSKTDAGGGVTEYLVTDGDPEFPAIATIFVAETGGVRTMKVRDMGMKFPVEPGSESEADCLYFIGLAK